MPVYGYTYSGGRDQHRLRDDDDNDKKQNQTITNCFRCQCVFSSSAALELHLRDCDIPWEGPAPAFVPWAFIPPPITDAEGYDVGTGRVRRGSGPGRRGASSRGGSSRGEGQGRTRGGGQADNSMRGGGHGRGGGNNPGRGPGRDGRTNSDGLDGSGSGSGRASSGSGPWSYQRGGFQRGGHYNRGGTSRRFSTGNTSSSSPGSQFVPESKPVLRESSNDSSSSSSSSKPPPGPKCSKCNLSFGSPQGLARHFDESPAHPNSGGLPPPFPTASSAPPGTSSKMKNGPLTPNRSSNIPPYKRTSTGPSQCTKCDLTFNNPQELAAHFYESPAHPFSVPPVGNRWTAPPFEVASEPGTSSSPEGARVVVPRFNEAWNDQMAEEMLVVGMRKMGLGPGKEEED